MEAYSLDLRERVAEACDEGTETREEIAERFGVSTSFIRKLLQRRKTSGSLAAKPHRGGYASAMRPGVCRVLGGLVRQKPDSTLKELRRALRHSAGVARSISVICRALRRMG